MRERNGIDATAEQVVVTSGAVAGIYSTMVSLVDPGAEMLLGSAAVAREGSHARVVFYSAVALNALEAAAQLAEGI